MPRPSRQGRDARAEQVGQCRWQCLGLGEVEGACLPCPGQLERVIRVASAKVVQSVQERSRHDRTQAVEDESVRGAEAQRTDGQDARRHQAAPRTHYAVRDRTAGGKQATDVLVAQPAQREIERRRRRGVEPLDVVDGNQQPPRRGSGAECTQRSTADRTRIERLTARPKQEGGLQRVALRLGKVGQS